MSTIDEKRVYGDRAGATDAYVASSVGVVRVRVNDDVVGEFGLVERCDARDVAAVRSSTDPPSSGSRGPPTASPLLAVATATDVLVATPDREGRDGLELVFEGTDFGPAVAVGFAEETVLAADPNGGLARRVADSWEYVGDEEQFSVRAVDPPLVGTDRGVYRVAEGELSSVGLSDVRDVSAAGVPLAATDDGLYALGNGWMRAVDGRVDVVAADPRSEPGSLDRAHAAAGATLFAHDDGTWDAVAEADDAVAGIAVGESVYAVTETGAFHAVGPGGLRSRSIGVPDVSGIAIPE